VDMLQESSSSAASALVAPKALVAMSGGVDSAVSVVLMQEKGFDCIGATMKLLSNEGRPADDSRVCCSLDDTLDAKDVARLRGIPHYTFNFTDAFAAQVIDPFIEDYLAGRTPNPCIRCNTCMKFDALHRKAREFDCSYLATGHYARIAHEQGRYLLLKGVDARKDQSYVLYTMSQADLACTVFPLGDRHKEEVREIAASHGLAVAQKPDSQDVCFISDGDLAGFLDRYATQGEGPIVDTAGRRLGTHAGHHHYTIGQRKGLGVCSTQPRYVIEKDAAHNTVVIGTRDELLSKDLVIGTVNLISCDHIDEGMHAEVKTNYNARPVEARCYPLSEERIAIEFREPQVRTAPGQSVVLYDGDVVIGGGVAL
jgi:tRNA-uridine 2-sulfurtransferase